jgi:hypothetical protein
MAKEQEVQSQSPTTTVNVSRKLAEVINTLARDAGESVREYGDRELIPMLRAKYRAAMKRRLASVELGGEGG